MPCIRSERMSVSLVSRLGPATAAVRVSTENSRNYRTSLRLRISREIFMPIIIIPPRRDCVIRKLRLVYPAKEMSKGCYYLIEPHSNRVHPVLFCVCVWEREREGCPAYIKIPWAIFSRILYSQSSAPTTLQNSCSGV